MKISASYLGIKDNIKDNIKKLDNSNIDFIHMDVMDGIYVPNKTLDDNILYNYLSDTKKLKDIHLMVNDVIKYVDLYMKFNPYYITFHIEGNNILENINYIKSKYVKVGLAIKPNTNVEALYPYLDKIDLVLIMSVTPGFSGQQFMINSIDKVNKLIQYRNNNHLSFLISIDGGINNETIRLVDTDIAVSGSFITNSDDYNKQIEYLK